MVLKVRFITMAYIISLKTHIYLDSDLILLSSLIIDRIKARLCMKLSTEHQTECHKFNNALTKKLRNKM